MHSHFKSIATLQDTYADGQRLAGIELDYSLLLSAMRCHVTVNLMPNSDLLSTGDTLSSSAIAKKVAGDEMDTEPLLES